MEEFDKDFILFLVVYNVGEGLICDVGGVLNFFEICFYVFKVLVVWIVVCVLCVILFEFMFDGCVFLVNGD